MDHLDSDSRPEASINLIRSDVEAVGPDGIEQGQPPLQLSDDPWDICMRESDTKSAFPVQRSPTDESVSESALPIQRSQSDESESSSAFPIQSFPIDILISIFLAAVDTKLQDGTLKMSRTHPAVVASHICREWREIALSTAALWRHIHLILPPYPFCLFEIMCARAKSFEGMNQKQAEDFWKNALERIQRVTEIWLSRSGDCPLSVNVDEVKEANLVGEEGWPEDKMTDGLVHLDKIVDLLCEASPRWRDFTFSCAVTPHTRRLLIPAQPSRILRSARVAFRFCSLERWQKNFMSSVQLFTTKSLRSLEIPLLLQDIGSIPINWSSLTSLTFGGYPMTEEPSDFFSIAAPFGGHQALEVLKNCPNLQRVDLHVVDGQSNWSQEPISLPFLEEIILQPITSPYSLPIGFAPSLILPSLLKFTMTDGYGHNIPSAHNGFVECIHQFATTLTDVTFCYAPLTQSALHNCLQQLPNLVRLNLLGLRCKDYGRGYLEQASLSRELWAKMTPQFDESGVWIADSCLCPRIREFGCRPNEGKLDEVAFVDFIVGRRRVKTSNVQAFQLEKAVVDCRGPGLFKRYQFEIDVVQELDRRGVDVEGFSFSLIH